jgi:voltage-gated potassium channel
MDPFKRLIYAALGLLLLIAVGTMGFHILEGLPFIDAVFNTVLTLTTVGLANAQPASTATKVFIMLLSLTGAVVIFILLSSAIVNAVEFADSEKMHSLFRRRKMRKLIPTLRDHYIVCGYGRMGQAIAGEFMAQEVPFLVIESNLEQVPRLIEQNVLFIEGDASDERVLQEAGVERAKGLISVAPSDADNTFIVLTAKGINPKLFVVARSIKTEDEPKLRRAGADRVISPYILGGKRMAWAVLRPNVLDLTEGVVCTDSLDLEIGQATVSATSQLARKRLRESGIREETGTTIIAIKNSGGTLTSSPSADTEIQEGDTLIAVGSLTQLSSLQNIAES